jgi:transaldolase
MKFFLDSADIEAIKHLAECGLVDGITTNPSLIAKSKKSFNATIEEICAIISGPVSAEVIAKDFASMKKEGESISKIAKNICIKLPLTIEGLKACRYFSDRGIKTNITLCFSANQALMAAKAGATFISPFVGRLDDIGYNGMNLIADICKIYQNYNFKTEVLVASIRSPMHLLEAAKIGAGVATLPTKVFEQLISHPLTENGLEMFDKDWQQSGQKIL